MNIGDYVRTINGQIAKVTHIKEYKKQQEALKGMFKLGE